MPHLHEFNKQCKICEHWTENLYSFLCNQLIVVSIDSQLEMNCLLGTLFYFNNKGSFLNLLKTILSPNCVFDTSVCKLKWIQCLCSIQNIKRLIRDYWGLQTPVPMYVTSWYHVIAIHCDSLWTNCRFLKTGLVDYIGVLQTSMKHETNFPKW